MKCTNCKKSFDTLVLDAVSFLDSGAITKTWVTNKNPVCHKCEKKLRAKAGVIKGEKGEEVYLTTIKQLNMFHQAELEELIKGGKDAS